MTKNLLLLIASVSIITLSGCIKPLDTPEKIATLDRAIGLPLIFSTITFADIQTPAVSAFKISIDPVEKNYVMKIGPLNYSFPEAGTLIKLAKDGINQNNIFTLPIANGPLAIITATGSIPLDLAQGDSLISNTAIEKILFADGSLGMNITSTLFSNVNVTLTFPTVVNKLANQPLRFTYQLSRNVLSTKTQNLGGYFLRLQGQQNLKFDISISIPNPQNPPSETGSLTINYFGLNNLKWARIDGKISNLAFPLSDQTVQINNLLIRPFSSANNANLPVDDIVVYFENPTMNIKFANTFGLNAQIILKPLISLDKDSVLLSNKTEEMSKSPFPILKPSDPDLSTVNFPSTTTSTIPKEVLKDLLNKGPKFISYGILLSISGANTSANDFILAKSKIETETEIILPLYGYLKNFKIQSDIDAPDLSALTASTSGENYSISASKAVFMFEFQNKIPLDILTKITLLDINKNTIAGINQSLTVGGGNIDGTGNVISAKASTTRIVLDQQQLDIVKNNCKFIRIDGDFLTVGAKNTIPKSVKFYPTNNLEVKMSFLGQVKIDAEFPE